MNVVSVRFEIFDTANAMVGESSLPNLGSSSKLNSGRIRISSLDELQRTLQSDVYGGRKQQVHMVRHDDEGMELESSLPLVAVECLQEKTDARFDNEDSPPLPGLEGHEISPGRGNSAGRFHGAAFAARRKSWSGAKARESFGWFMARLKPCPSLRTKSCPCGYNKPSRHGGSRGQALKRGSHVRWFNGTAKAVPFPCYKII